MKSRQDPRFAEAVATRLRVPFSMLPEAQAKANHGGQSLAKLASRGGLSACEAVEPEPAPRAPAAADDALLRLRTLRLWHYRALLKSRANQRSAGFACEVRRHELEASVHLGFVQSLNDFFEATDTAEHDDQREDAA